MDESIGYPRSSIEKIVRYVATVCPWAFGVFGLEFFEAGGQCVETSIYRKALEPNEAANLHSYFLGRKDAVY